MVRNDFISYLVSIKICESDEYQECSSQRDFAVKQSQSFLEAEYFPLFSLGKYKSNHDPRTIAKMVCWICSNILLNN